MVNDAIDLNTIRRVLVIKLRHHGDVLLTSPVFSVLKNHAPHLEIDALVYQDTADMLMLHPAISQVHCIDRKWKNAGIWAQISAEWRLFSALRSRHYDLIVHLTPHPRGAWLKRLLGARYGVTQSARNKGKFWRNSFSHMFPGPKGNPRHMAELNLDALRRIGVYPTASEKHLVLTPGAEANSSITTLLQQHNLHDHGFIHVHPTSRWLFKCWTPEKMTELIMSLQAQGHHIVITAAPSSEEMDMVKTILSGLTQPVTDLSGKLSLKQLAALTARARCFIGVDSAPMHIAAAMQTPVVVLFGPSGEQEWGPWMTPQRVITSSHSCRPCGNDGCGGSKVSECLTTLPVPRVLHAVEDLLRA